MYEGSERESVREREREKVYAFKCIAIRKYI